MDSSILREECEIDGVNYKIFDTITEREVFYIDIPYMPINEWSAFLTRMKEQLKNRKDNLSVKEATNE